MATYDEIHNVLKEREASCAAFPNVPFQVALYEELTYSLPESGNHILCCFDEETIILYQSVPESVAMFATRFQSFKNQQFKVSWRLRTTFPAAVNTSEWGKRQNHGHLLAITVKRLGFEEMVRTAVLQMHELRLKPTASFEWAQDVDLFGEPEQRGEMSLILKGKILENFLNRWIIQVNDITTFVSKQRRLIFQNRTDLVVVPQEEPYVFLDGVLGNYIGLTQPKPDAEEEADGERQEPAVEETETEIEESSKYTWQPSRSELLKNDLY